VEQRIAVIGIIITDRSKAAGKVNNILTEHGEIIVGRLGLPYEDRGLNIISLIVDGSNDELGALAGKLGNVEGAKVKTMTAD
jgi:putative iron-only hydrogenase system regulator